MAHFFAFQWHITDACDQRCRHCYIYADNPDKIPVSMSWPGMQTVVDRCTAMCTKFDRMPEFYLTGGDPLLHPDFWSLAALLKEKAIPFTILGNPYHLTGFYSNSPRQTDMDDILAFLETHHLKPHLGRVYEFARIRDALEDIDNKRVQGKVVIRVG